MKFNVLDKVKVTATGNTGIVSFPYNYGEKVVVTLDGGRDREYFAEELEHLFEEVL